MADKMFMLRMTEAEHTTIKRRAASAKVTMRRYIIEMTLDQKIHNRKPKKQ